MTFIADERFQSFYVENTGLWTLQIKYVQARDAGIYECQVSTEPKVSARVHLHVVGKYIYVLDKYMYFPSLLFSQALFYLMLYRSFIFIFIVIVCSTKN